MKVYRIGKKEHATLDGKGAAAYPGRWNKDGSPCLYTSDSPSLAQLEIMVNTDDWRIFSYKEYVILEIEIAAMDAVKIFEPTDLPKTWDGHLVYPDTQEFGASILGDKNVLGFSVPSAIMKLQRNYILNSRSIYCHQVSIIQVQPFKLDPRLI